NTGASDFFGISVGVSADTAVVGAHREASSATGVNGNQSDDSSLNAGAAYVFERTGTNWSQQAYLKASNTGANDEFGWSVAVHGDTAIVGARMEDSNTTGLNGDESNNDATNSGAAYVFVRAGTNWNQQAYLKASNTGAVDFFGGSVAVFGDTVVVGAQVEDSNATGVNGDQTNYSAPDSGAAYVFTGFCPACPKLTLAPDGTGGYFIRFTAAPDVTHRLQRALNFTGSWDTLAILTAPASGLLEFHDASPPPGQAFYRTAQP
ncbi:MAG TPA: FG-GAP repeat protein, partial [Verrucomicrobiae bacterium]|nr:FG-GAP repeat protein [Verrucomicrobiae bacterium]